MDRSLGNSNSPNKIKLLIARGQEATPTVLVDRMGRTRIKKKMGRLLIRNIQDEEKVEKDQL